jgi:hypothetical protein
MKMWQATLQGFEAIWADEIECEHEGRLIKLCGVTDRQISPDPPVLNGEVHAFQTQFWEERVPGIHITATGRTAEESFENAVCLITGEFDDA